MSTPLWTLIGFVIWTLLLVFGVGIWRASLVFGGKRRPNQFTGGTKHGSDPYWRLNRAHANAVENLPIFGAVVVVAVLSNTTTSTVDLACQIVLGGRIAQSIIHVSSGSNLAVNLRFAAFLAQLFSIFWIMYEIARHA